MEFICIGFLLGVVIVLIIMGIIALLSEKENKTDISDNYIYFIKGLKTGLSINNEVKKEEE